MSLTRGSCPQRSILRGRLVSTAELISSRRLVKAFRSRRWASSTIRMVVS
jgi:hypothetical protein